MATLNPISAAETPKSGGKSPRIEQVSGQMIPIDAAATKYRLSGKLIGTWLFPPVDVTYYQSETRLYTRGAESFEGCVNLNGDDKCDASEPRGRWTGEYIYWASLDQGRLVEGGCVHALTGGTKAFVGVRGLLRMTDVYASTKAGSTAIYQGEVILNAKEEGPVAKTTSIGLAVPSSTSAAQTVC
ncbi:MAG: hypothetical protein QM650_16990 [Microlunatus sp.]